MLSDCGVEIRTKTQKNKSIVIELDGVSYIESQKIKVPGDPSTAAFIVVAALITKNSKVLLKNIYYDSLISLSQNSLRYLNKMIHDSSIKSA